MWDPGISPLAGDSRRVFGILSARVRDDNIPRLTDEGDPMGQSQHPDGAPTRLASHAAQLAVVDRHDVAPDGSDMCGCCFVSPSGAAWPTSNSVQAETSVPVRHRTVSEIWYIISGRGAMWLHADGQGPLSSDLRAGHGA